MDGAADQSSTTVERIAALREEHGRMLDRARDEFDAGQTSLAAKHDQDAMKIANTLSELHRLAGNACSDCRLLEWER